MRQLLNSAARELGKRRPGCEIRAGVPAIIYRVRCLGPWQPRRH